jgi:hypothetical protein
MEEPTDQRPGFARKSMIADVLESKSEQSMDSSKDEPMDQQFGVLRELLMDLWKAFWSSWLLQIVKVFESTVCVREIATDVRASQRKA